MRKKSIGISFYFTVRCWTNVGVCYRNVKVIDKKRNLCRNRGRNQN